MKFVISFLFLLASAAQASRPIIVYYELESTRAHWVKDIFTETYRIPEDLIALKNTTNCLTEKGQGQLNLCLNKNGDLEVVSVDRAFINESLKIFVAP
jgi:hypothetical protein